jgi:hypothetical protein
MKSMDGGFNTLSYLLTQQNDINAKLLQILSIPRPEGLSVKILRFFGLLSAKVKPKTATDNQGGN